MEVLTWSQVKVRSRSMGSLIARGIVDDRQPGTGPVRPIGAEHPPPYKSILRRPQDHYWLLRPLRQLVFRAVSQPRSRIFDITAGDTMMRPQGRVAPFRRGLGQNRISDLVAPQLASRSCGAAYATGTGAVLG